MFCQRTCRTANNYKIADEHTTWYIEPLSAKKYQSDFLAADKRRYFHTLARSPLLDEIIKDSGSGVTFTII